MIIAGIDEAGRGPVLGPMVMSVAVIDKKDEESLVELGVRDSKELSPLLRKKLALELEKRLLEWKSVEIHPEELDTLMSRKSLNEVEAMKAAELLNGLSQKPEIVFVDSPDLIENNFALRIKKYSSLKVIIKAEHKADSNYPIVSAASIIAKVKRDKTLEELSKKFGNMGSGYPHDPVTVDFLEKWIKEKKSLPPFARKKWSTSQNALNKRFQTKLSEYFEMGVKNE